MVPSFKFLSLQILVGAGDGPGGDGPGGGDGVGSATEGSTATEVERFEWGSRVREVEQGPDGSIWVLEDAPNGRLIKFTKPR